jgi:hypothetical protein
MLAVSRKLAKWKKLARKLGEAQERGEASSRIQRWSALFEFSPADNDGNPTFTRPRESER